MSTTSFAAEEAMRRHLSDLMAIQQLSMPLQIRIDKDSNKGSVLAVVNFPENPGRDCNGIVNFGKVYQLRLDYDHVVALGSTKIMDMLKQKKQEKFRRLLRMEALPAGIDYVLDFTPPLEGEECSELTASLWLPASTKIWWMAGYYKPPASMEFGPREGHLCKRPLADKAVGAVLSLGHDDECPCATTYSDISHLWASADDVAGIYDGKWVPSFRRNIKDYCRLRHCMNIVRILRAIAGEDLLINSATRMWTLAHLALYLDVVPVVRDSITQWFSACPNTKFIEIFPEESFNVALKLRMRDVLLASFRILVNERAVDHAATIPLTKPPAMTWMERQRTDYGDLPEDPIEHASRAFADRMKAKLDSLRGDMAYGMMAIVEWERLQYYCNQIAASPATLLSNPVLRELSEKLSKLKEALLKFLQVHVTNCLAHVSEGRLDSLITAQRDHYCPPHKQTPTDQLLKKLNDYQKACLPFFWYGLKDIFPDFNAFKSRCYQGESIARIAEDFNDKLDEALLGRHLAITPEDFQSHLPTAVPFHFNLKLFYIQLELQLSLLSLQAVGFRDSETEGIQFYMSDHLLLTLEESELKYLPLWAGGFDDGSGGVFQSEVPWTDMGPSEPGPHYHTGHTIASNTGDTDASSTVDYAPTSTFSEINMEDLDLGDYTTARSNVAQDSISTIYAPSQVVSMTSETFTGADDVSMAEAMFAVPAEHQGLGQAVAHYVEGVSDGDQMSETQDGDEAENGDDDEAMDSDSTLSLGTYYDDDDDAALL
ncbi:hypothetical protein CONLIGDRAFT_248050 [Coniochaeta ligniaria NRRL 30616]|uniref:Uncharacterized protein n=1 Tax=Coniochaeta ligniaria NRRL 30616 TaxID=1408157 RepID=A0A1J7IWV0_9PEZI|nr:hypothetical protein CONLIGDRAFT_248050 [Coniochaeta ligniaria NRRL 30616]